MGVGDDFFFTDGGFSDWSGGSAGRFSSSGGFSGGGHYTSTSIKKKLEEERRLGYPSSGFGSTLTGPSFINHLWLRWFAIGASLAMLLLSGWVYLNKVDDTECLVAAGVCYLFGAFGMLIVMMSQVENYPMYIYPTITENRYRRFYNHQRVMLWFCFVSTMFFSLTPFICWLFEDFINAEMNHDGILSFLHLGKYYDWYYDKYYDVGWLLGGFVTFFSILSLILLSPIMMMCRDVEYKKRLRYILNKAGVYDEAKRNNIARIAEIDKMIKMKQDEIRQLNEEKISLDNPKV